MPDLASKARKQWSLVAPMNTSPPAVTIGPPAFREPAFRLPSGSDSTMPKGTCQAISPVFAFTATSRDHGGFWQGQLPTVLPALSLMATLNGGPPARLYGNSAVASWLPYFGFCWTHPVAPASFVGTYM